MNATAIKTELGASASLEDDGIVLRDAQGDVVVTYSETSGLKICSPSGDLTLSAPNGRVVIEGMEASVRVGRFELEARRIVESAVDVYRTAQGLAQMRAGRLRRIVDKGYELFADHASISSKRDTSIDGRRVLLG